MATSLDTYPNSYDLQAAKPIQKILESHFLDIKNAYEFQEAKLEDKKQMLLEIALEIDQDFIKNHGNII